MNYGGMRRKMFRTLLSHGRPMRLPSRLRNDRHAISKKEKGTKERGDRSLDRNFGTLSGSHACYTFATLLAQSETLSDALTFATKRKNELESKREGAFQTRANLSSRFGHEVWIMSDNRRVQLAIKHLKIIADFGADIPFAKPRQGSRQFLNDTIRIAPTKKTKKSGIIAATISGALRIISSEGLKMNDLAGSC